MINLDYLTHAVQVRRARNMPWETIAAFDHPVVAGDYARECQDVARLFRYRVINTQTGKVLKPVSRRTT